MPLRIVFDCGIMCKTGGLVRAAVQPFRFAGAYYESDARFPDETTGLYKMGARYYDPRVGRFTQPDPVAGSPRSPTSYNAYVYVGNNPVNRIDPSGYQDIFVYLEGDLVGGGGIEGGVGIVFDLGNLWESGVFGSAGPAAGANAGWAAGIGFVLRELEGWSASLDVNAGKVSGVAFFDEIGFNGVALGLGPGAGMSVSVTKTSTYTVGSLFRRIKSLFR